MPIDISLLEELTPEQLSDLIKSLKKTQVERTEASEHSIAAKPSENLTANLIRSASTTPEDLESEDDEINSFFDDEINDEDERELLIRRPNTPVNTSIVDVGFYATARLVTPPFIPKKAMPPRAYHTFMDLPGTNYYQGNLLTPTLSNTNKK